MARPKSGEKRVSNYFNKQSTYNEKRKTGIEIKTVEFTLAESEFDALLLRTISSTVPASLQHLLKDDKSFPVHLHFGWTPLDGFPADLSPDNGEYLLHTQCGLHEQRVGFDSTALHHSHLCVRFIGEKNIEN